jgi:hypothetical protein
MKLSGSSVVAGGGSAAWRMADEWRPATNESYCKRSDGKYKEKKSAD